VELCLHFPNTPTWRGAQLKHTDNFAFVPEVVCNECYVEHSLGTAVI
jgi:hypothetical protein